MKDMHKERKTKRNKRRTKNSLAFDLTLKVRSKARPFIPKGRVVLLKGRTVVLKTLEVGY